MNMSRGGNNFFSITRQDANFFNRHSMTRTRKIGGKCVNCKKFNERALKKRYQNIIHEPLEF